MPDGHRIADGVYGWLESPGPGDMPAAGGVLIAGWAFAKLKFRGGPWLLVFVVATMAVPISPLAPGRASRMKGWPTTSVTFVSTSRDSASAGPPGGQGMITRTGRDG